MIRRLLRRIRRARMPVWLHAQVEDGPLNVVPVNDLIPHQLNDDCVCGPTVEAVFRDDGSNAWLYIHHSLDGREAHE